MSFVRDDDLRMAFGSQSAALEQWLLIPDALRVHVLPCLDVINGIDHKVQPCPELIIEVFLSVCGDLQLHRLELAFLVNLLSYLASYLALVLANVLLPEKKLTVEVADFNVVVICANDPAFPLAPETH